MNIKIYILALFSVCCFKAMAQKNDYAPNWKRVSDLEGKGLTKAAQDEVKNIYNLAVKSGNEPQQIKAVIHLVKYTSMVEEDNFEKNYARVDSQARRTATPLKNIFLSMQAEILWRYKQNNRWKFYNRTEVANDRSTEIGKWSLQKLNEEIAAMYKASIAESKVLSAVPINNYEGMLEKGSNARNLRPTLFDFLAFRALEYFTNEENDITSPAYRFIINDEKYMLPAPEFIKLNIQNRDSSSLYLQALKLYQQILRIHINDNEPSAFLDADLQRLEFVYNHGVFNSKETAYEAALTDIQTRFEKNPLVAMAMYQRAQLYQDRGNKYDPLTNNNFRDYFKKAKLLADSAYAAFPKTQGGAYSKNLSNEIIQPSLFIETEAVNIPGEPFRALVKYKSAPKIHLRLVKVTREEIQASQLREEYTNRWTWLLNKKAVKEWNVTLPDNGNYQQQSVEIKVDAAETGTYYLIGSLSPSFSVSSNILTKQVVHISNISFISSNQADYYVLHRKTGEPLMAQVQIWDRKYNYTARKYDYERREKYTTGKDGHFKINKQKDYRSFQIQVIHGNDDFFPDTEFYNAGFGDERFLPRNSGFIFTDRSIYRPGQTVFFKGILIKPDTANRSSKVLPNVSSSVTLYDVNNQVVNTLKFTTNKFGSFNGSFTLPSGQLNGQFYLRDSLTSTVQYIQVEEYKRPSFTVEIEQPKNTYRLNDSVKVKGKATAYAGNAISNAEVTYRVIRKMNYPFPYYGYASKIWPPGNRNQMEITNGKTITDDNGNFFVSFKAIPDETHDSSFKPVFTYEVMADVTDINGETRSKSTSVSVSKQSLFIEIEIPEKIIPDSLRSLEIKTTNINGTFQPARVSILISKLESSAQLLRLRYWNVPDQFIYSKEEFKKYFPDDPYKDEGLVKNWPVVTVAYNQTDSTVENKKWNLSQTLKPGWYKITARSTDKDGNVITSEKFIEVIDPSNQIVNGAIKLISDKKTASPGDKVNTSFATAFKNIWLVKTESRTDNRTSHEVLKINSGKPVLKVLAVSEADRGGISIAYAFVKNNRVYNGTEYIDVPWTNKELNISYETFRDKLTPGSKETWKLKISGANGDEKASEILVSMYDASLDQFKPHAWHNLMRLWLNLPVNTNWTLAGFNSVNSEQLATIDPKWLDVKETIYDRFIEDWEDNYTSGPRHMKLPRPEVQAANVAPAVGNAQDASGDQKKVARYTGAAVKIEEQSQALDTVPAKADIKIQSRKNFNETAFFFPALSTDANGNTEFTFTIPEALTQWKIMSLAHTEDLKSGYAEKTVVTQKELMVQPNMPRFMRQGDSGGFAVKVVNTSGSELTGTVHLELFDAATNKPVDGWFKNVLPNQYFTVGSGGSQVLTFPVEIPQGFLSVLGYRIIASSKKGLVTYSDGEENAIPVLSNRLLVTESLPLNMRNTSSKTFRFDKLLNSGNSGTLTHHSLTVEYTGNPLWYVVQALPYLKESKNESSEQLFNRIYANTLASHIVSLYPAIKTIFEKWNIKDTSALISNLLKNEELKNILVKETPWVMDAANESEQRKNIAMLFNSLQVNNDRKAMITKLQQMQAPNGGFTWFKGGPDDRYITQNILTGIGHLIHLKALSPDNNDLQNIIRSGLNYLDNRIKEDYERLVRSKTKLTQNNLSAIAIQYLYMRSFFKERIPAASKKGYDYYIQQSRQYWLSQSKYMQAMIALVLNRQQANTVSRSIIESLKQNAITNEEMGMYWKDIAGGGYYWYQAPIEAHSVMIEAFTEVGNNQPELNDLKTWLIKQKQTQNWKTGKATADACYALLVSNRKENAWLNETPKVTIQLGNKTVATDETEAATGYFKQTFAADKVEQGMGNIQVKIDKPASSSSTSWGAVYWQYLEDMDKITSAATPLKLVKRLFIERNSDKGPVLHELKEQDELQVGDKIKVRIELVSDRNLEYVHMKDMRSASMEPVNVISGYKYQDGLAYYETTGDAATDFFFNWLPRGTYIFEYPLFVSQAGNYSNGITTIQCLYAPEFMSHSNGMRVNINSKKQTN